MCVCVSVYIWLRKKLVDSTDAINKRKYEFSAIINYKDFPTLKLKCSTSFFIYK